MNAPSTDERTTITRDDDDPLAQMLWQVWDTGRPMVGNVTDDGEFVTRFMDEKPVPKPNWVKRWQRRLMARKGK